MQALTPHFYVFKGLSIFFEIRIWKLASKTLNVQNMFKIIIRVCSVAPVRQPRKLAAYFKTLNPRTKSNKL